MNTQFIEIGKRIQLRRKELKIAQSQLAERINISNNHMSSIERGMEKPSIDVFMRICEELNVTPDYILLGNMHADNTPQNIIDNLRLCHPEDVEIINQIVKLYVYKNRDEWNEKHFT